MGELHPNLGTVGASLDDVDMTPARRPILGDWRPIPGTDAIEVWDGYRWIDSRHPQVYCVQVDDLR